MARKQVVLQNSLKELKLLNNLHPKLRRDIGFTTILMK
jgi:hypothetical protein